jgi:protein-L-isoaspartate(D-aspartate) O-methyltransferase
LKREIEMTIDDTNDEVTIKTVLRPDFYESFPLFSIQKLHERLHNMPFHLATLLDLKNIITALSNTEAKEAARAFFESDKENQRNMLKEVMLHVGISHKIGEVIGRVKRELFVPPKYLRYCYLNHWLDFDKLSSLSTPGIVYLMTEWLQAEPGQKILEVGIGSGYHAACVSESVNNECEVFGIELSKAYAEFGQAALEHAGYKNIRIYCGDGYLGWPMDLQFDRIYMTASYLEGPPMPLLAQLCEGGLFQGIRALNQEEFESEDEESWLRKTYVNYSGYREVNWRNFCCLFTARKENGNLVEINHLYDVAFKPFHQKPEGYGIEGTNPFLELEKHL